jgi:hypothetical protein
VQPAGDLHFECGDALQPLRPSKALFEIVAQDQLVIQDTNLQSIELAAEILDETYLTCYGEVTGYLILICKETDPGYDPLNGSQGPYLLSITQRGTR